MGKNYLLFVLALAISSSAYAQKVLFDNTKAESAGNADWVIDADAHDLYFYSNGTVGTGGTASDAQRYPTPAQSGITPSTTESYWEGALSAWGVECVKSGYTVESLPYNVAITYGNSSNPQDLSHYDIYVIDEPNIQFSATEKAAILNFVYHGGGLFMISDHDNSDRNNDGWDSPNIWNDLMTTNTVHTDPFGISFDLQDFSGVYVVPAIAGDSLLDGPYGRATEVKWTGGTTMTLNTTSNPTVKGDAFKSGSGTTNVMVAHGYYGKGRFAAMSDSSPADDASGDPGDVLYDGWITDAGGNHRRLIMNATIWLAGGRRHALGVADETADRRISVYPNPTDGRLHIESPESGALEISDLSGQKIYETNVEKGTVTSVDAAAWSAGIYIYRLANSNGVITGKVVKN